ncbi:hypothetical protein [Marinoscillum luteum]|uniref:PepSY domain-containing protein n=1 Tax=Marinoscillum luteum TaxID=861051 RepID=A0ABW7N5Q2_9BACT
MKLVASFILLIFSFQLKAQTFETAFIIEKADSILKASVDERLYQFYTYDSDSYYEYVKKNGKTSWETLNKKGQTKGKFVNTNVRFDFKHPEHCWITGYTGIKLNANLELADSLNTNFLPEFLINSEPSNFISEEEALKIAKPILEQNGINQVNCQLTFDLKTQVYIWAIEDLVFENYSDFVNINAVTGEITEQGQLLRSKVY